MGVQEVGAPRHALVLRAEQLLTPPPKTGSAAHACAHKLRVACVRAQRTIGYLPVMLLLLVNVVNCTIDFFLNLLVLLILALLIILLLIIFRHVLVLHSGGRWHLASQLSPATPHDRQRSKFACNCNEATPQG
jgi:hypothetical protein